MCACPDHVVQGEALMLPVLLPSAGHGAVQR